MAINNKYPVLRRMFSNKVISLRALFRLGKPFSELLNSYSRSIEKHEFPSSGGAVLTKVTAVSRGKKHIGAFGILANVYQQDKRLTDVLLGADGFDSISEVEGQEHITTTRSMLVLNGYLQTTLGLATNLEADVLLALAFEGRSKGPLSTSALFKRTSGCTEKGLALQSGVFTVPNAKRKLTRIALYFSDPAKVESMFVTYQTSCALREIVGKDKLNASLPKLLESSYEILVSSWKELKNEV